VYGTLPCHLAARVCDAGAQYWHLQVPAELESRGRDLGAAELQAAGASFVRCEVRLIEVEP
jgi:CRISPR-associated protein Csx16